MICFDLRVFHHIFDLSAVLNTDKAQVNYRLLSRELKIHVNEAKQYLQQFYTTHSKQVTPSYVLTGKPKDTESNKIALSISIVPDEQNYNTSTNAGANAKPATSQEIEALLNETKNKYQTLISCHIYSLSPLESLWRLSEIISGIESKLEEKFPIDNNKESWDTWGIIKNPEPIPDFANVPQAVPSLSRPQAPANVAPRLNDNSNNQDTKTPKAEPKVGITSRYVSRKQQQQKQQQQNKSDSVISALNKSTTKGPTRSQTSDTASNIKAEPENGGSIRDIKRSSTDPQSTASASPVPAEAPAKAATPSYRYVSRKAQKNQPVEKVVISHGGSVKPEEDEEIEDIETFKQRKVKEEQQRKELESLFDDDEEEEDGNFGDEDVEMAAADADTEVEYSKNNDNGNIEPISISTDTTELNYTKQAISVPSKSEGDSVQEILQIPEEEQAPEEELQSYVDEDGYLVSKKVNNTAKKSSPPASTTKTGSVPKPKSRPLSTTNDKGKKKQKQSSLLSFFNKK